jgi:hypothetical protein
MERQIRDIRSHFKSDFDVAALANLALQLKGALRNVFLALVMVLIVVSTVMIYSR